MMDIDSDKPASIAKQLYIIALPRSALSMLFIHRMYSICRQVMTWNLHEMRLALSSDLGVYRTPEHPAFTIRALGKAKRKSNSVYILPSSPRMLDRGCRLKL